MTKEATKEFKIGLVEFEGLAKKFISKQDTNFNTIVTSKSEMSEFLIRNFKEFIFSEELNQQKRKQEYFKLKEQLESMKEEFEPDLVKDAEVTYSDCKGAYVAVKAAASHNCSECAFANRTCGAVIDYYSCGEHGIIWIKK